MIELYFGSDNIYLYANVLTYSLRENEWINEVITSDSWIWGNYTWYEL